MQTEHQRQMRRAVPKQQRHISQHRFLLMPRQLNSQCLAISRVLQKVRMCSMVLIHLLRVQMEQILNMLHP